MLGIPEILIIAGVFFMAALIYNAFTVGLNHWDCKLQTR